MQANKGTTLLDYFTLGHLKHSHNRMQHKTHTHTHKMKTQAKTKLAQQQATEQLNTIA
jgi:hypothetical protein